MEQGRESQGRLALQSAVIMFLMNYVLSVIDLYLTIRLYTQDMLEELNPVADQLFQYGPKTVIIFKVSTLLIFSGAVLGIYYKKPSTALKVLAIALVVMSIVMIQHIRILAII